MPETVSGYSYILPTSTHSEAAASTLPLLTLYLKIAPKILGNTIKYTFTLHKFKKQICKMLAQINHNLRKKSEVLKAIPYLHILFTKKKGDLAAKIQHE